MNPSICPNVSSIEAWKCVFPLTPFRLGYSVIAQREYVLVRVTASDGSQGTAFGLTRGAPTDLVVSELVGERYLGRSIDNPQEAMMGVASSLLPHYAEGLIGRAMSLIDLAIWDIKGQHDKQPVWEILGAKRKSAPVMLVEGYPIEGESDDEYVERLQARAAEGYSYLKLAYTVDDPKRFTRRLHALRDALSPSIRVSVDVSWCWSNPVVAKQAVASWEGIDLVWIEDPIPADDLSSLKALKNWTQIPIGIGDEVARPGILEAAVRSSALDVLRIDATCAGGFSRFGELARTAEQEGLLVSTHVYPEIHLHAALGATTQGPIEMFPVDSPWDAEYQFVQPVEVVTEVESGIKSVIGPKDPGLGITIDWDAVEYATVRASRCQVAS